MSSETKPLPVDKQAGWEETLKVRGRTGDIYRVFGILLGI